jgi:hypothetical protein
MSDKDYLSELKRGREEEFFQRQEKELMDKMRRDKGHNDQTVEPTQESKVPDPVKPQEAEVRTPTSRYPWVTAFLATAALIGLVWVWMAA